MSKHVTGPGSPILDAAGYLLPAISARVLHIMAKRGLRSGQVLTEMGYSNKLDPALGLALRPGKPYKVRPDLAVALEKWLDANKGVS